MTYCKNKFGSIISIKTRVIKYVISKIIMIFTVKITILNIVYNQKNILTTITFHDLKHAKYS